MIMFSNFLYHCEAIPIKCFVSHHPISCDDGSVGQAKKKNEHFCIVNLTFNR